MEWTDEKVFKLIKLYESFPCMYDVACKEYHNRIIKKNALEKMAIELQSTGKLDEIRDALCRTRVFVFS